MKKVLWVIFGMSLCAVASAKDCESGATTQGEVAACAYDETFAPLEQKVVQEYQKLLRMTPDDGSGEFSPRQHLKDAQEAWVKYRDATCDFMWDQAGRQTLHWGVQFNCLVEFNRARIKTLQRYQENARAAADQ